jgi:hypothetical protein
MAKKSLIYPLSRKQINSKFQSLKNKIDNTIFYIEISLCSKSSFMKEKNAFTDGHLFKGRLQCLLVNKKNMLMIEQVLNILCNFLNIIKIFPHYFVHALSMTSTPLKDQTIFKKIEFN